MNYPKHRSTKVPHGEKVVVARDNEPLAKLVPVAVGRRQPGSAKGRVSIGADFDAPLYDFSDYR